MNQDSSAPDNPQRLSPYANWFGIRVEQANHQQATLSLKVVDHHLNTFGTGHGGVCLSLADHACGVLLGQIAPDAFYATVTLNSAFFHPVQPGTLQATATLLQRSRTLAHIEAELWQANRLVFKSSGSFAIRPKRA